MQPDEQRTVLGLGCRERSHSELSATLVERGHHVLVVDGPRYHAGMAGDRIAQRVERLLDEADAAIDSRAWEVVRDKVDLALVLDPNNTDGRALKAAAERGLGQAAPTNGVRSEPAELGPPRAGSGTPVEDSLADRLSKGPRPPFPAIGVPPHELANPPLARTRIATDGATYELGRFRARVAALLLDAVFGLFVLLAVTVGLFIGFVALERRDDVGDAEYTSFVFVALTAQFLMAWTFEGWGRSPGKAAMGLRVVRFDGRSPGAAAGLGRVLGRAVSALPLGLGYLWASWDERSQTWHDKLSRTHVVRSGSFRLDRGVYVVRSVPVGGKHRFLKGGLPATSIRAASRYRSREAAEKAAEVSALGTSVYRWRAVLGEEAGEPQRRSGA